MDSDIAAIPIGSRLSFSDVRWFKRGELQEELAEATAAAGSVDPLTGPTLPATVTDDPLLTNLDYSRLSLVRTDAPEATLAAAWSIEVPSVQMSYREIVAEATGTFQIRMIVGAGFSILAVLAAVGFALLG